MVKNVLAGLVIILLGYGGLAVLFNHDYSVQLLAEPLPSRELEKQQAAFQPTTVRVLIIDGGGVKGILSLMILKYFEQKSGKTVSELFDFFSGTSTGSIIVSALNLPNPQGKARFTVDEVVRLLTEQ